MNRHMIDRHSLGGAVALAGGATMLAAVLLSSVPTLVTQTAAATPHEQPKADGVASIAAGERHEGAFVQWLGDEVLALVRRGELARPAGQERFRKLLVESIDLNTASRSALGRYWREATDAQLARYRAVYLDYVLATYSGLFSHYPDQTLTVTGGRAVSDDVFLVDGTIERPDGAPIAFAFRVRKTDDGFKVLDIFIERISMLVTQRSDFAFVIQREGMDGLLTHLEEVARRNGSAL